MKTKRLFIVSFIFKILPPSHCHKLKSILLRWCGAKIGKNVEIFSSAKILGSMNLEIGDNVFIGHEALIFGASGSTIKICDYAKVGSRSIVVTGYHRYSPDGYCIAKEGIYKDVTIEDGATVFSLKVDSHSTYGNSIMPSNKVDVYVKLMEGDKVVYQKYSTTEVKINGEEFLMIKQNDILAIIVED